MFEAFLITHFIGDFILQSDSMAKGKSSSILWLGIHIITYTLTLFIVMSFFMPIHVAILCATANGLFHMVVDYFTSRMTSKLWKQGRVHDFFVVIGFDQLLHVLGLYWTYLLI